MEPDQMRGQKHRIVFIEWITIAWVQVWLMIRIMIIKRVLMKEHLMLSNNFNKLKKVKRKIKDHYLVACKRLKMKAKDQELTKWIKISVCMKDLDNKIKAGFLLKRIHSCKV